MLFLVEHYNASALISELQVYGIVENMANTLIC